MLNENSHASKFNQDYAAVCFLGAIMELKWWLEVYRDGCKIHYVLVSLSGRVRLLPGSV